MKQSDWITIYNMRLAGQLMSKGFVLMGIGESKSDTSKKVFFFRKSIEIQEAIEQYKLR